MGRTRAMENSPCHSARQGTKVENGKACHATVRARAGVRCSTYTAGSLKKSLRGFSGRSGAVEESGALVSVGAASAAFLRMQ